MALCGSKTAHVLDGCSYPSGCVTTLQKFLKSFAEQPNLCFTTGDVVVWADYTQRKSKTCRVREDGTTPTGIIPMLYLFNLVNCAGKLQ